MHESGMEHESEAPPSITTLELFYVFLYVGLSSFGGGTSAWMHREIVERRKLMDDEAFMAGLTIAQVLPGANPVNMSLYLGMQLRGRWGAVLAVIGMVFPAFCVILLLGFLYRSFGQLPMVQVVLGGMAGVGIGATLALAVKAASRRAMRNTVPIVLASITFITVGILRWPMVPVVIVLVPASIAMAYAMEKRKAKNG